MDGPPLDVEMAVLRRLRILPIPSPSTPRVSLWQFGWASAASVAAIVLGAVGIVGTLGVSPIVPIAATWSGFLTAARTIAWAALARIGEFAGYASSVAAQFEGVLITSASLAVLACAAMVTLTVLVVSREALGRKVVR